MQFLNKNVVLLLATALSVGAAPHPPLRYQCLEQLRTTGTAPLPALHALQSIGACSVQRICANGASMCIVNMKPTLGAPTC